MRNDTDIAIICWATSPMVRRTGKTETQLLLEAITDAVEPIGLTRADVDFTCAGSCDYVVGHAFSFVSNIDAIGAWPPKRDSHVEMDGAWAMYEAWLRLQHRRHRRRGGHGLRAFVDRRSRAHLPDGDGPVLPRAARRRPVELRRAAGAGADRRGQGHRAPDGRGRGAQPPRRQGRTRTRRSPATSTSTQLLAEDYVRAPLRRHDLPPITDGACAVVLATRRPGASSSASVRCGSPASPTAPSATTRHCATSPTRRRPARRRRRPGSTTGPIEVAEIQAAFTHEEFLLRRGARARRPSRREPVGRRRSRPTRSWRPASCASPRRRARSCDRRQAAHARALDVGSVPATEPRLHPGGRLVS